VLYRRTMRSRARAPVRVISKRVDVHATLGIGVVAADVPCDLGVGVLVGLLEGDGALDVGIPAEDGDYLVC
jgi:hypothetical protein